MKSHF